MATPSVATPNVAYKRPELQAVLVKYEMIGDVLAGSLAVKAATIKYLPKPNADDVSPENGKRYRSYLKRAVFYNVTGRTLRGLTGQIFARDPVLEVPAALDVLKEDTNGEGIGLTQLAKKVVNWVISYGRSGLFVDYPNTNGRVTRKELEEGGIRPTITAYSPDKIINWRTRKRGAASVLSLVVLEESYVEKDDGFEIKLGTQWRVLRLSEDEEYSVEIWRQSPNRRYVLVAGSQVTPTDANGRPFRDIPFFFIGSENNDSEIDEPPLFDLADLNLAHYRNSADHEENIYISAQATPVISGLTESWADKYFKNGVPLGPGASIPLPSNADAKFIQAEARTATLVEMEHKEKQMVALGAKLVENKEVQRTATEAKQEEAGETSVLSDIAGNVSSAFTLALKFAARFAGAPDSTIKLELNKDFAIMNLTAGERQQVVSEWQDGAITFSEMRAVLRKTGVATLSDDEAQAAIAAEMPAPEISGDDDPNNDDEE